MLSKEDNAALTRVGRGTPMGQLFRRFWLPALLASEVPVPDGVPVRLRILGEDLLAFRDTQGKVGIIEAFCSHRRAPLFFGRNEEHGIRCPYHGWKFDHMGACVDLGNVPGDRDQSAMRARMNIDGYPTREAGGLVWVYMGPAAHLPALPDFEWMRVPDNQRFVMRWLQRSNFMQGVEGEIDTSHISFLHKDFDAERSALRGQATLLARQDGAPELTIRETPYGFIYGARRNFNGPEGRYFWRITQWLLPMYSMIPRATDAHYSYGNGRMWVPVDDDNVITFHQAHRVDRPFGDDELADFASGKLFPPRLERGSVRLEAGHRIDTWLPVANPDNDYLVDRAMQKTFNFTGIWGANEQDRALQEAMNCEGGPSRNTVDRSREHLVGADKAIITARRMLLGLARELAAGGPVPAVLQDGSLYGMRAISRICDIADFDEFLAQYGDATRAPHAPDRHAA